MALRPREHEDFHDYEPAVKKKMVSRRKHKVAHKKQVYRNPQKTLKVKKTYVKCLTINTDASFHPKHNVGGWAFYIKSDQFTLKKGGEFRTDPKDSNDAEMMAVGNAIAQVLKIENLEPTKWLIINMDCVEAMNHIKDRKTDKGREINDLWQQLIKKLGSQKNKFRHVKAHTGNTDGRSKANEWCDKEAKKNMRIALNKKRQNEG